MPPLSLAAIPHPPNAQWLKRLLFVLVRVLFFRLWHRKQQLCYIPPQESDWTISEMLTATTRILESNTIYRGALASNIRAFDKAVQMEFEMEGIKADLKAMRKDNREMADRMERMEELLISLGANTQEKRDSAANS